MQRSFCILGTWTSITGTVLAAIYLGAAAGMFLSGTIPPDEPYITIISLISLYFDISVAEAGGASSMVLSGEGYRANRDGGLWEKKLPPGIYRLVLSADQSPETILIF